MLLTYAHRLCKMVVRKYRMKALDLSLIHSNSPVQSVDNTEFLTVQIGKLNNLKQAAPLPVIPEVKFVVTKGDLVEEFESYRELYLWAVDQRDINRCAREEFCDFSGDMSPRDIREFSLVEYVSENLERLLGENDYKLSTVVKG